MKFVNNPSKRLTLTFYVCIIILLIALNQRLHESEEFIMPGPGGGSRGGGFGGGGSRGGGFGGGGHHGGGHHHHHHGYYGGFYRRPYGFFGGGGFFGGLLGIILLPIIAIFLCVILLIVNLYNTITVVAQGGEIVYDETVFQDYAMAQYDKHFTDAKSYEDNLLLTFLTFDDYNNYYCIAFIGDNVKSSINLMFGNEYTELGYAVKGSISSNYKYSLDSNIAIVMDKMSSEVASLNLSSPFYKESGGTPVKSKMTNYTTLALTEQTVNDALERFTEETGIPAVVVVDTAENVFGKTMPVDSIIVSVITVLIIIGCVWFIISKVKRKNNMSRDFQGGFRVNSTSSYGNDYF